MKIKELRLINITVKENEKVIYQGTVEDAPEELKDKEYTKAEFDGVDLNIEI